jgi:hypothetical protein
MAISASSSGYCCEEARKSIPLKSGHAIANNIQCGAKLSYASMSCMINMQSNGTVRMCDCKHALHMVTSWRSHREHEMLDAGPITASNGTNMRSYLERLVR